MDSSSTAIHPRLERDRLRKQRERAALAEVGLRAVRVYLTAAEYAAIQAKAQVEGWDVVFSPAARRDQILRGVAVDLTAMLAARRLDVPNQPTPKPTSGAPTSPARKNARRREAADHDTSVDEARHSAPLLDGNQTEFAWVAEK